jgi:hypothetical protein
MGDRFYTQQKNQPGRRLKKDVIKDLEKLLGIPVSGLDRLTIKSLDELIVAVAYTRTTVKFEKALRELAK